MKTAELTREKRWLRRSDVLEELGMSEGYFTQVMEPYIEYIRFGDKRNSPIWYDRKDIDKFMESRKTHAKKQII